MIIKRNSYQKKKEKENSLTKRIAYINLKYNLDQVLQEISLNNKKNKKS